MIQQLTSSALTDLQLKKSKSPLQKSQESQESKSEVLSISANCAAELVIAGAPAGLEQIWVGIDSRADLVNFTTNRQANQSTSQHKPKLMRQNNKEDFKFF